MIISSAQTSTYCYSNNNSWVIRYGHAYINIKQWGFCAKVALYIGIEFENTCIITDVKCQFTANTIFNENNKLGFCIKFDIKFI